MYRIKDVLEILAENRWLLCQAGFGIYISVLAFMDIRKRKLDLRFLMCGVLFAAAGLLCGRTNQGVLLAAGAAVGILFLLISRTTGESLGYGDSILIVITGAFLGFWNLLYLLVTAFSAAAVFSVFMMIRKKFHRRSSFPFVPFLAGAYIGGMFFAGY